jgi:response regulator NasT
MARKIPPTAKTSTPPRAAALKVVLVDDDPDRAASVRQALAPGGYEVISLLASPMELYEAVVALKPDVIIVSSDSPSRDAIEHIALIGRDTPRPVVMFSGDRSSDTIRSAIRAGVSAYIVDGLSEERLQPILDVAIERFETEQALKRELADAKSALADRKLVERAKGAIMKQRGVDEEEAFRLLRSFAMENGVKLADAATRILEIAKIFG